MKNINWLGLASIIIICSQGASVSAQTARNWANNAGSIGVPADGKWSTTNNWDGNGLVAGSSYDLYFRNSTINALTNDVANLSLRNIMFYSGNTAYVITGSSVNLIAGTLTNNSGQLQTLGFNINDTVDYTFAGTSSVLLSGTVLPSGGRTWTNSIGSGGALTIANLALISASGNDFALNSTVASSTTVLGNISGTGSGVSNLYIRSVGTVILSGSNSSTNNVWFGKGSAGYGGTPTVIFDYTTNNYAKLGAGTSTLALLAGTYTLRGGSVAEQVSNFQIGGGSGGDSKGIVTLLRDGGSSSINITNGGKLWRDGNNTLLRLIGNDLISAASGTAFTTMNGMLTPWVTVNNDWAKVSGSNTLVALTASDYAAFTVSGSNNNNSLLTGSAVVADSITTNSLKIATDADGQSLQLGGVLTLNTGGLMFVGANNYLITGGTLAATPLWNVPYSNNRELIFWQNGAGTLEIASNIVDGNSAVTKAGAGTLILSGSNSYGSTLFIQEGTLKVGSAYALSRTLVNSTNLSQVWLDRGTLDLNGFDVQINGLIGDGNGGTYVINSGANRVTLTLGTGDSVNNGDATALSSTQLGSNINIILSTKASSMIWCNNANPNFNGTFTFMNNLDPATGVNNGLRIQNTGFFGTGTVVFAGFGGFGVINNNQNPATTWTSGTGWGSTVIVSGTANSMHLEVSMITSGTWLGNGDLTISQGWNPTITFNGNMSQFSGTLKFKNINNGVNIGANSDFSQASLAQLGSGGTSINYLQNTTANQTVKIGDLYTYSSVTGSADMGTDFAIVRNNVNGTTTYEIGAAGRNSTFGGLLTDNGVVTSGVFTDNHGSKITAIRKVGPDTWTLTNGNTYTGKTEVNGGTLLISGTGSINGTSEIDVNTGGQLIYNSSVALTTKAVYLNGGALGGTGTVSTDVCMEIGGGILTPGSGGIGTLTVSGLQEWDHFTYDWEIASLASSDLLALTDSLTLGVGEQYTLNISGLGGFADWNNIQDLVILSADGGITNFNAANWTVSNPSLTLTQQGNELVLNYSAVPEPSAWLLMMTGSALLLALRRRFAA